MERVVEGLHRINLGFVNAYLLETPELVLVDAGMPGSEQKILKAMQGGGFSPDRLAHIVGTHAHVDHVGSLAALAKATGAEVWMHVLDAPQAEKGEMRPIHPAPTPLGYMLYGMLSMMSRRWAPVQVDHRIEGESAPLPFGGLLAIHAPGHCLGQIALHWPSRNAVIMADAAMHVAGLRLGLVNEDLQVARDTLRRLSQVGFEIACFGHGAPLTSRASDQLRRVAG